MMKQKKLTNSILYLLESCGEDDRPGVTRLLKMLWFADYWHYRAHLKPITEAKYSALKRGPVVDGYKGILHALVDAGVLERHENPNATTEEGQVKIEYIAKKPCVKEDFSESELKVLQEVVRQCKHSTGNALSERSHREGPWQLVWNPDLPNRSIPLELCRWVDNLPDESDLAVAREVLARPHTKMAVAKLLPRKTPKPKASRNVSSPSSHGRRVARV